MLLVYSIDNRNSFNQLQHYYSEALRSTTASTAFVLVANKLDLEEMYMKQWEAGASAVIFKSTFIQILIFLFTFITDLGKISNFRWSFRVISVTNVSQII